MTALGRLFEVEQFEDIIVKVGDDGGLTHLRDVARLELGAQTYDTAGALLLITAQREYRHPKRLHFILKRSGMICGEALQCMYNGANPTDNSYLSCNLELLKCVIYV